MTEKKALLIVNIGTPDKPEKKEVRRYLREFLNDRRVIDIPWLAQKILVNLIIIPLRTGYSTKLYQQLWTKEGSPLLIHLNNLSLKLQDKIKGEYTVYRAMRYGNPSLAETLEQIKNDHINKLTLLPLFPQYASSTTASIIEKVFKHIKKWKSIPSIHIIEQFYNHPAFINAYANLISQYNPCEYEHVIFSYHGLPLRQINKVHPEKDCVGCLCESKMIPLGTKCYKATCYETTRLLVGRLNIPEDRFTVSFQSRLSKNWLSPFTDELIVSLARKGLKNILISVPSFVADCLETIVEIEQQYQVLFNEHGGHKLTLVRSLNDSEEWADALLQIAT